MSAKAERVPAARPGVPVAGAGAPLEHLGPAVERGVVDQRPLVAIEVLLAGLGDVGGGEAVPASRTQEAGAVGQLVPRGAQCIEVGRIRLAPPEAVGQEHPAARPRPRGEPVQARLEAAERVDRAEASRQGVAAAAVVVGVALHELQVGAPRAAAVGLGDLHGAVVDPESADGVAGMQAQQQLAGAAADVEHALARLQRDAVDDFVQTRRVQRVVERELSVGGRADLVAPHNVAPNACSRMDGRTVVCLGIGVRPVVRRIV